MAHSGNQTPEVSQPSRPLRSSPPAAPNPRVPNGDRDVTTVQTSPQLSARHLRSSASPSGDREDSLGLSNAMPQVPAPTHSRRPEGAQEAHDSSLMLLRREGFLVMRPAVRVNLCEIPCGISGPGAPESALPPDSEGVSGRAPKHGGQRGIRTLGAVLAHTRFPSVRIRPLCHLSVIGLPWEVTGVGYPGTGGVQGKERGGVTFR